MIACASTLVFSLSLLATACDKSGPALSESVAPSHSPSPTTANNKRPLSELDLSRIGHIASKGRVQDKEYNNLGEIEELIASGKDSIPFLISKLEDETAIKHHVLDYWPQPVTVGDVAYVILMDFTTDSSSTKNTIPGTDRDSLLGKYDPDLPGVERLARFVEKHGRKPVRQKWEKVWAAHKDQIVWDERERCFKLGSGRL